MEKKKLVFWFIFTDHGYTNEVISRELPAEDTLDGVECSDGVIRKLWKCDGPFVTKILKNKKPKQLDFSIFKRDGKYGTIKEVTFFEKKKKQTLK